MVGQRALLVIDMQKGSFTPQTPRFAAEQVVGNINALSRLFRRTAHPVIFIQHNGTRERAFVPNTTEWELLSTLEVHPQDTVVSKTANDAFYRSKLSATLAACDVKELVITGCATDFCVEATVHSALAKDYQVTVVEDGHTTAERPHLSAQQVIAHYNWVWRHLTPTHGSVRVVKYQEVESSFP